MAIHPDKIKRNDLIWKDACQESPRLSYRVIGEKYGISVQRVSMIIAQRCRQERLKHFLAEKEKYGTWENFIAEHPFSNFRRV